MSTRFSYEAGILDLFDPLADIMILTNYTAA